MNEPTYIGSTKYWYNFKGEKHNEFGPAVVYENGNKEWWLNNTQYTEYDYQRKLLEIQSKAIDAKANQVKLEYWLTNKISSTRELQSYLNKPFNMFGKKYQLVKVEE